LSKTTLQDLLRDSEQNPHLPPRLHERLAAAIIAEAYDYDVELRELRHQHYCPLAGRRNSQRSHVSYVKSEANPQPLRRKRDNAIWTPTVEVCE
jgi:hypothetical protein